MVRRSLWLISAILVLLAGILIWQWKFRYEPAGQRAEALLYPLPGAVIGKNPGSQPHGRITFLQKEKNETEIRILIHNIPAGMHGLAMVEECKEGSPHWNPDGRSHGRHDNLLAHRGDLGNVYAAPGQPGGGLILGKSYQLSGKHAIIGLSVAVYAEDDKYVPDAVPGKILACGKIESRPAQAED